MCRGEVAKAQNKAVGLVTCRAWGVSIWRSEQMMADTDRDDSDGMDSSETELSFSKFVTLRTDKPRQPDSKCHHCLFILIIPLYMK